MSGINLKKKQGINLSKVAPGLSKVRLGLGWNTDIDLDASVFIVKAAIPTVNDGNPKLVSNDHLVFYGNTNDPAGAIIHSGDARVGTNNDDSETITIDLGLLSSSTPAAAELSIIVTIHDDPHTGKNFSQVPASHVTLYNDDTGAVIARYDLDQAFTNETAVQFGSLVKNAAGEWEFVAVGDGSQRDLGDYVLFYGGTLA